VLDRNK